ncbi:MAG: hypothetical protein WCL50_07470 [Spirochaetota bacterium]
MNHGGRTLILLLILASAVVVPASSFTLDPMTASLAPLGPGAIGTFRVKNDGTDRIAIRLTVVRRSMAPDGNEITEPAEGQFKIYPARLVIEAGSTAAFKIQWRGESAPTKELCFRLVADQVPIDFGTEVASGIRIMFRYIASVYITPAASAPELLVESAEGGTDEKGNAGFRIAVRNSGRRHVIATEVSFELKETGAEVILLGGDAIGLADGANYLPGLSRLFFVPNPAAVPGRVYEALLHFAPEY